MTELIERVRSARNVPRNAWATTSEGRATRERAFTAIPETVPRNRPRRRTPAFIAAAAVVIAVVIAVAAAVVPRQADDTAPRPQPASGPLHDRFYDGEWRVVGPEQTHEDQHFDIVWTGKDVLAIDVSANWPPTVSSLDLRTGRWTALRSPPVDVGPLPDVAWTGTHLILWGGGSADGGAAYDPKHDTWTPIPPPPIQQRRGASAVWTGRELVVLGGDTCLDTGGAADCPVSPELQRGAAYDPDTGRWRRIATAPVLFATVASAVAVRGRVVVVDPQPLAPLLSYDPDTDAWRALSAGSVTPSGYPTPFRGDVVTFGLRPAGANRSTAAGLDQVSAERTDPVTGRVTPFGSAPLQFVCGPATAVVPDGVVVACSEWVRVAPASGTGLWRALPSPPVQRQIDDLAWTGRELVATVSGGQIMVYTPGR